MSDNSYIIAHAQSGYPWWINVPPLVSADLGSGGASIPPDKQPRALVDAQNALVETAAELTALRAAAREVVEAERANTQCGDAMAPAIKRYYAALAKLAAMVKEGDDAC